MQEVVQLVADGGWASPRWRLRHEAQQPQSRPRMQPTTRRRTIKRKKMALAATLALALASSVARIDQCTEDTVELSYLQKLGLKIVPRAPINSCSDAFRLSTAKCSLGVLKAYSAFRAAALRRVRSGWNSMREAGFEAAAAAAAAAVMDPPACQCDRIVVTGACSVRGCAKPDSLVILAARGWRTPDGRYIYTRDVNQPALHSALTSRKAFDESSGSDRLADQGPFTVLSARLQRQRPRPMGGRPRRQHQD